MVSVTGVVLKQPCHGEAVNSNAFYGRQLREPRRGGNSDFAIQFNSIQDYLYSAFHDTIVAKQFYIKLSFYNRFIYCRNLIYLTYDKIWLCILSEGLVCVREKETGSHLSTLAILNRGLCVRVREREMVTVYSASEIVLIAACV